MKHLKVFEAFEDIDSICKEYNISNYTINNGLVDVDDNVEFCSRSIIFGRYSEGLTKLPLKFGKVTGYFDCNNNQLTTLEGCPYEVGGSFNCNNNQLTTLEGAPSYVGISFNCSDNQLTTLEGGPNHVGGNFYCSDNQLTTLEGGPNHVGGGFDCINNQLITLEGSPIEVGGYFYCYDNPIHSIYELFPYYKAFMYSLDYGYLRGTDIVKMRFQEACEEAGIRMPKKIKGYNWI